MDLTKVTRSQKEIKQIGLALHDLCQPLTTLHCRLELAQMIDTPEGYQEAVDLGLLDSARLLAKVATMRDLVRTVMEDVANQQRESDCFCDSLRKA